MHAHHSLSYEESNLTHNPSLLLLLPLLRARATISLSPPQSFLPSTALSLSGALPPPWHQIRRNERRKERAGRAPDTAHGRGCAVGGGPVAAAGGDWRQWREIEDGHGRKEGRTYASVTSLHSATRNGSVSNDVRAAWFMRDSRFGRLIRPTFFKELCSSGEATLEHRGGLSASFFLLSAIWSKKGQVVELAKDP